MTDSRSIDHIPVLCSDAVGLLTQHPGGTVVDGTVGLGGHAEAILDADPTLQLVGIDRDAEALDRARMRLARFGSRARLVYGNYRDLERLLDQIDVDAIDGLLLDLGVSSLQLDDARRGFSFRGDGSLDMRMDRTGGSSAAEWLATASQMEIAETLRTYGEERYAERIARAIDQARCREPVATTGMLAEIVRRAVPAGYRHGRLDPATRTFQAIRIRVNGELDALEEGLCAGFDRLTCGGVLAAISFHSLEDRIVKRFFQHKAADCVCPPELPECLCDKKVEAEILTKRPLTAAADEIEANPRARSAKLRAVRKVV